MPATWNPADKVVGITLSNGDRTATVVDAGTNWRSVRSTDPMTTGKVHVEFIKTASNTNWHFGIGNAAWSLTDWFGTGNTISGVVQTTFQVFKGASSSGDAFPGGGLIVNGVTYAVEVDFDAKTMRFYGGPTPGWGPSYSFSAVTGPYYLVWGCSTPALDITINTGQSAFVITPTSGFEAGWGAPLAPAAAGLAGTGGGGSYFAQNTDDRDQRSSRKRRRKFLEDRARRVREL